MATQNLAEVKKALDRGDVNLAQALGISVEEEGLLAQQGHELMTAGRLADAEKLFNGLAALNPSNSYYSLALGNIKKANNQPKEAIAFYERAVAANPSDLGALFALADTYMRSRNKAAALPRLLQILYIDEQKASEQGREADAILKKYFSKDEVRGYVEKELDKLPRK